MPCNLTNKYKKFNNKCLNFNLYDILANRKFNELTEADQNIKKTLKSEVKKAAKITKNIK